MSPSSPPENTPATRIGFFFDRLKCVTRDTAKETWNQIREAHLPMVASSLAYTTILSLVPLLAVSFSIFKAFGGIDKLYDTIEPFILQNLAQGASEDALAKLRSFISNIHAGALGTGGLIALIITCMTMLSSAEQAINRVWKAPLKRGLFNRVASYWLFITLGPLLAAIVLGAVSTSRYPVTRFLPDGTGMYLIITALLFLVYKWVPHRKVHVWPALIAAVTTSLFWELSRLGFALYTSKVLTYDKIYGSLGAIPILLLWIYILWLIILGGAAFSAALQKRVDIL